jgi:O-acetyl-ADP-ribose deacetylase
VRQGDIADESTECIVNSTNSHLIFDEGLSRHLVMRGGKTIQDEANVILKNFGKHIPPGNVIATSAGALPFKKIIHVVSPVWTVLGKGEFERTIVLKTAIHNSLELASMLGCKSIAFPALSTACYRFPIDICAESLFSEAIKYAGRGLQPKPTVNDIRFTLIDELTASYFVEEFDRRDFTTPGAPYKYLSDDEESVPEVKSTPGRWKLEP